MARTLSDFIRWSREQVLQDPAVANRPMSFLDSDGMFWTIDDFVLSPVREILICSSEEDDDEEFFQEPDDIVGGN
jgi:hypothetical protein